MQKPVVAKGVVRPRSNQTRDKSLRRRMALRCAIEAIEPRVLLSTITVNTGADSGTGSLRAALLNASPGDSIDFAASVRQINLTSAALTIGTPVNIVNDQGTGPVTVVGGPAFRVFTVNTGIVASISGLTITGGNAVLSGNTVAGGGIFNSGTLTLNNDTITNNNANGTATVDGTGGGIVNVGTLTLNNSTVSGNAAHNGGISSYGLGGGIANTGTLTLTNSTVTGNAGSDGGGGIYTTGGTVQLSYDTISNNSSTNNNATGAGIDTRGGMVTLTDSTVYNNTEGTNLSFAFGGGIEDDHGTLVLINSTVSGNAASFSGGGIENYGGNVTLENSTISGNTSTYGGGGVYNYNTGTLTLTDTIIAGNTGSVPDIDNAGGAVSGSFNLIGDGTNSGFTNGVNGNMVGVANPGLSQLGNFGGPTQTIALLPGSPAIDHGSNALIPPNVSTDQRGVGFARIVNGTVDIGAFEFQAPSTAITGTVANQMVNDNATIAPFANVTFSDPNPSPTENVTITWNTANGTFSDGVNNGLTTVSISGALPAVQSYVRGLVFHPTNHQVNPGNTVTTVFTISDTNGANFQTINAGTSVIATAVNNPPTILGALANQMVTDNATIDPFAGVTFSDPDLSTEPYSLTVTLSSAANGQFSAASTSGWTSNVAAGVYSFSGTRAQAQTALEGLVFIPTNHQVNPGNSVTTTFALGVTDGPNFVSNNTTSVIATAFNNPPIILGTLANQMVNDNGTVAPFSGVIFSDPDLSTEAYSLTVTLSNSANGQFSAASTSGWTVNVAAGTYSFAGTRAQAQAALEALIFVPTNHEVAPGNTVTTTFTIAVTDGPNLVTNNTTSVITTAFNNPPTIVGTVANQMVNDNATIAPFSGVTFSDPDLSTETYSITVTLNSSANGQFSAASTVGWITNVPAGTYTFSGTRAQAQVALEALVFVPTDHQVAPGNTVKTTFTIAATDGPNFVTNNNTSVIATAINTGAIITGTATGTLTVGETTPASGKLTVTDPDFGQAGFQTPTSLNGADGTFTFNTSGNWSYTLNNALPAVQALTPGQHLTDMLTVTSIDGTASKTITITINAALTMSPAALTPATLNVPTNQTINVLGGTAPYTNLVVNNFQAGGTGLAAPVATLSAGTVVLSGTPTATGTATFSVMVTDSAGATLSKNYSLSVVGSDIAVSLVDNDGGSSITSAIGTAIPGTTITYSLVVLNNGPANATSVSVVDVLPPAFNFDSYTAVPIGGAIGFTPAGTGNVNDLVNIPAGAGVTYTIVANINVSATGTMSNTATASVASDNNPANNTATDIDLLQSGVQATPTISNTAGPTVVDGTGVPMTDSATLSGGINPSGMITFTLYSPSNVVVDTETAGVSGNGTYSTPIGYLPTAPGTYQWVASYGGDPGNKPAATTKGAAPEVAVGPGVTPVGTTLYLVGGNTNTNDQFSIQHIGSSNTGSTGIQVSGHVNGVGFPNIPFPTPPALIDIVFLTGNDNVNMEPSLNIPATVSGRNGNYNIQLGGGNNTVTVGSGNDQVTAGDGNNTIVANTGTGQLHVNLGKGNNTVTSADTGNGMANIQTGDGNNTITTGNGNNDQVHVGNGSNIITMGNGNNDQAQAGNGSNTITIGSGNDQVQAGDGNNTIVGNTGAGQLHVNLGKGNNSVTTADTSAGMVNIQAGDGNNTITTGNGTGDQVHVGNGSNVIAMGNGNNDNAQANNGANMITLGSGSNDQAQVGNGNNVVVINSLAGTMNDQIAAGGGKNFLIGGLGQENIHAGGGSNILIDGSVQLVNAGDSLAAILSSWIVGGPTASNEAGIESRMAITYNTTNNNALNAGGNQNLYLFIDTKDHVPPTA